jgi:tetratricopeptide (TPR) repeat protein
VAVAASPGAKPTLRIIARLLRALPDPDDAVTAALAEIGAIRSRHGDDHGDDAAVAYDAIDVLIDRARQRPLVVTVDDFQWADDASARTLTILAREAGAVGEGVALMVIVVVREDDTGPPDHLAELVRSSAHRPVRLSALAEEEIDELIRAHGVVRPTRNLVRRVAEFSGGNPLFVREAVLRADQSAHWRAVAGGTDADLPLGWLGAPGDLGALVARRSEELGADVVTVLEHAALTQDRFDASLLATALGSEVDVVAALDRAADAGLIEPSQDGWTFAHAVIRQAMAAAPDTRARPVMHAALADAWAALADPSDDDLLAEAHHRVRSDLDTIDRAQFDRLGRGARICLDQGSWGEAAEYLRVVARLADRFELDQRDRAWLDYRLGRALHQNQEPEAARDCFERAGAAAADLGDARLECRALGAIARQVHSHETEELPDLLDRLGDAIGRIGPLAPDEVPALEVFRIEVLLLLGRLDEAMAAARASQQRAATVGDAAGADAAASAVGMTLLAEGRPADALTTLRPLRPADTGERALTEARLALGLLMGGRLDDAVLAADRAAVGFAAARQRWGQSLAEALRANVAAVRGDLDEAQRRAERSRFFLVIHDYMLTGLVLFPAVAELHWWIGDEDGARRLLEDWAEAGHWNPGVLDALFAARSSDMSAAARIGQLAQELLAEPRPTLFTLAFAAPLAEAARLTGSTESAASLAAALDCVTDTGYALSPGGVRLRSSIRADLAALTGDHPAAADHLRDALAAAESAGAHLDEARAHLDLGTNPSLSRADRITHLDQAGELADRLGLWRVLEQAGGALDDLRGDTTVSGGDAPYRIVMITDLVGSTALSAELGDRAYLQAIDGHHRLVRRELRPAEAAATPTGPWRYASAWPAADPWSATATCTAPPSTWPPASAPKRPRTGS